METEYITGFATNMITFNAKKRLFKQKVNDVTNSIFELEFKIYKSRQLREESRILRDRAVEQVGQIEARLKGADKKEKPELEKELAAHQQNKTAYEGQMKMIDEQVHGAEGTPGLMDTLKGLAELRQMYKDYIKLI